MRLSMALFAMLLGGWAAPCSSQLPNNTELEHGFRQRADLLLAHVAQYYPRSKPGFPPGFDGRLSDFGKYNYPLFIAWMYRNDTTVLVQEQLHTRMRRFASLPTFHFNLVGLPRLLYLFPQHPSVRATELSFLQRVFERKDSYNAFTAEGTENHVSMSKTSAYLYAQLAAHRYPDLFPGAGKQLKRMKRWIMHWSKQVYYRGTGEFNSAIYQAYTVIGWINLFDFAADPEVKAAARAVLDYYAAEMALHFTQGIAGGSDLRGQHNTRSLQGSYAYLAWLWFGDVPRALTPQNLDGGMVNHELIQSVHAATSSYRPPAAAVVLATQKFAAPAFYYNSKPAYLLDRPGYIRQTFFVDRDYTLGAGYFPYGGWGSGNNQVVEWKLVARTDTGASAQFISGTGIQHPAAKAFSGGNRRVPFDQVVHHRNVLIQLTRLPLDAGNQQAAVARVYQQWQRRWATDFARRFPNDTVKLRHNPIFIQPLDLSVNRSSLCVSTAGSWQQHTEGAITFVAMDRVYLAIRSVRGDTLAAFALSEGGTMKYSSVSANAGAICGFVLEVASQADYNGFADFRQAVIQNTQIDSRHLDDANRLVYTTLHGDVIEAVYQTHGHITEPIFDFGYGVGRPRYLLSVPPFRQPRWPSGEGYGRVARWWVNGSEISRKGYWPVYGGDNLFVGKGKLAIKGMHPYQYEVDYTGAVPVFGEPDGAQQSARQKATGPGR